MRARLIVVSCVLARGAHAQPSTESRTWIDAAASVGVLAPLSDSYGGDSDFFGQTQRAYLGGSFEAGRRLDARFGLGGRLWGGASNDNPAYVVGLSAVGQLYLGEAYLISLATGYAHAKMEGPYRSEQPGFLAPVPTIPVELSLRFYSGDIGASLDMTASAILLSIDGQASLIDSWFLLTASLHYRWYPG